jgi:hypothetical protein
MLFLMSGRDGSIGYPLAFSFPSSTSLEPVNRGDFGDVEDDEHDIEPPKAQKTVVDDDNKDSSSSPQVS